VSRTITPVPAPTRRALLLSLIAALVAGVLAACGGGHAATPAAPSGASTASASGSAGATGLSTLHWGPCTVQTYTGHYQCATLQVPMDYTGAVPGTLSIALIKTPATDPSQRIGSLLINPGGPGESALGEWDFLSGQIDATLHKRFDVIGFDPRGVGYSTAVNCLTGPQLDAYTSIDLAPTTAAQTLALETEAKTVADECAAKQGTLLRFVGTANAAHDMDLIRAALGEDKLTYLGFSYGTLLGATYAQEFPTHVRAFVLDGAVDPSLSAVAGTDQQSKGFQAQLDAFLANCAGSSSCAWKFSGDAHVALRALLAKITASPLRTDSSRNLTVGNAFYGIGVALYDQSSWPALQQALGQAASGDGTGLLALADDYTERNANGTYSNSTVSNLAIDCRDYAWPRSPATFLADAKASAAFAPDFGPANLDETLPCAYWPADASGSGAPGPDTAVGAPPILVVATTGDPATPYSDGVALANQLSSGVLLTNVGQQHTAYGYSACVRTIADNYLITTTNPGPRRCDDE
jgi:pimeloyl-ACP methyl ester carboxylesterase